MMPTLAERKAKSAARAHTVYRAIIELKQANDGNSPTIRELMTRTGINSTSMVNRYLDHLVREGLIDMGGFGEGRSIRVRGGRWTYEPAPDSKGQTP